MNELITSLSCYLHVVL